MADTKEPEYKQGNITFEQLQDKAKALHKQIEEIPNPYELHLFDMMADFFGAEEALKFYNVFKKQYGLIGMPRGKMEGLSTLEQRSNGFVLYCLKNLMSMTALPPKPVIEGATALALPPPICSLDEPTTRSPLPEAKDEKKLPA
jgi:hypothetical protein